jgi:predicted phage tail protein
MIGGPSMVAGGITSGASALILAPNEPCSVLSAKAAGPKFCLKADAGNSRVQLTWSPSAPVGSVIVYAAPAKGIGHPAAVTNVTDKGALVTHLKNRIGYTFWLVDGKTAVSDPVPATPTATPAAAPGTPGGLTAAPGDRQVTLSWDPPASDGGSRVSGYNVYQGTSPGGEATTPVNGSPVTSTSYTVTGLTNGSTYYFTVEAVNAQGPGTASGEVPAVPVTVPGPPGGLTAAPGDAKVTLVWDPPASDGGSRVSGYNVYYATSADFKEAGEVPGVAGTALVLVGLVNGTPYYFRVTAVNKAGESQPSGGVPAVPVTVPGPPGGLTATAGDAKVTLAWSAPASDGGSPVTGYDLYVGTTAHFTGRAPLAKVTGTAVTVTGLANGTTYYFRATAVNKVGEGPASDEVPVTQVTVPGAPVGLTATPGQSKVTLAWTAPASGGSPIRGYIIYQGTSPGGETGTPVSDAPVTGTSYTVTGLTNGTTYYFRVVAINAAGLSPLSAEASATLPVIVQSSSPPSTTPPSTTPPPSTAPAFTAPTGLTATAGDTQVHLSWTAPTSDGGSPVVNYKIYIARVPGVQEIPAIGNAKTTDVTVTHLHNKAVYYFMVTGVNASGQESPLSTEVSAEPAGSAPLSIVSLNRPTVSPQLIALLAAIGAMVAAGAFTLIGRSRRLRSRKGARSGRSDLHTPVASDVRAVPDTARPDVSVRDTGTEPTHTVRLEPHPGVSTTTIKEGRP